MLRSIQFRSGVTRRLTIAFGGLVILSPLFSGTAASAPTGLLCQLMEHPETTVITDPAPKFGWIYEPSARDDRQTGYRIIVASSRVLANRGVGDIWDSGPVTNAASINVRYAGSPLQPGKSYFWRVQTRDSAGQFSSLSVPQEFRTAGELSSPPVVAPTTSGLKWIWYPGESDLKSARYFRKTFVVPANRGVAGAQFLLAVDNAFSLYVNGTPVGNGNQWKQFNLFTLGSLVRPGTNTVAIAATNLDAAEAGLTGKLQYLGQDGSKSEMLVDETWRASRTAPTGWNLPGFDDTAWPRAALLGKYGIAPWRTNTALPPTGVIYNSSTNPWANRYPLRFVSAAPVLVTNTAPGRWYIDFGKDAFAYATLRLDGAFRGRTIQARFGERSSGLAVDTYPGGTVRYATSTVALRDGDASYEVRPPIFRGQTIDVRPVAGVVMPFRYLELIDCPGPVTASSVRQHRLEYEFNDHASTFDSSSPALNEIWALCKYSMKATSFAGVYVDGDRERKPYEADAYINQLSHYAVDREFTLARYTQEYLLAHPTWPTEWKFHSILLAWADYLQTSNTELLFDHYDALVTKLFLDRARSDGLIRGFPDAPQSSGNSDIVDWPGGERDGFVMRDNDYSAVINAFYYRCLRIMTRVARLVGRTNDAAEFKARADRVYSSYNRVFWDRATHAYVDGEGIAHSSAHANFFPLAFGLVPATNQRAVLQFLHTRGMAPSVYGAQYLLDGLFDSGDADYALGLMATNGPRGWLNMIHIGSTITTEAWDFRYKPNMDWNHAWGAAAGNIITRHVLGLHPLEAGYGRVLIQPQLGHTLEWAEGTIPTIRGPVFIRAENSANGFRLQVKIPGNVTATVKLPTKGLSSPTAIVDGQVVAGSVSNGWLTLEDLGPGQHSLQFSSTKPPSPATLHQR